jgi:hypothetical protein
MEEDGRDAQGQPHPGQVPRRPKSGLLGGPSSGTKELLTDLRGKPAAITNYGFHWETKG